MTQLCVFWPGVTCPLLVSFPVFTCLIFNAEFVISDQKRDFYTEFSIFTFETASGGVTMILGHLL